MKSINFVGFILMLAGLLIMIYGGFSYTKKTHIAKLGSVQLSVKDKQTVYIPIWIGVTSLVLGGGILLIKRKKQ